MSNKDEVQTQQPVAFLMQSTIADVLSQRIQEMSTSPKMLEIIDKHIEGCLTGIISDTFSRYGDFAQTTKKAFEAALPGNINSVIDLGRYNAMIQDRLRKTFASSGIANDMAAKAESTLKEVMDETLLPPVILLSQFCEAYIEDNRQCAAEEQWEAPDFRLKESDTVGRGYMYFHFNPYKENSSYISARSDVSLDNYLAMSEVEGEQIEGNQVYEIYAAKMKDKLIQHIISTDLINRKWQKMMFALYYGQAKICIDCDPDDYYYPGND